MYYSMGTLVFVHSIFLLLYLLSQIDGAIDRTPRVTACINQIKPDKDEIAAFRRKEIPKTDRGKCLLACYLNARGVMSEGKFSPTGASKLAARAYPGNVAKTSQVRHILSHCGAVVSNENDKCELATKLAHCTTTMSEKMKILK